MKSLKKDRRGATDLAGLGSWSVVATGVVLSAVAGTAVAAPEGERVVHGNVQFQRLGAETIIRASNGSIINYRNFDIARGETVRFVQPSATSRVLNRIESARPTRIDGSLISNGRVYMVNPAGVYFGQGSVINVGGLYAGAATITDSDFLNGINRFTDASGSVVNQGLITGSFVGLLGAHVENAGQIVSPNGTVVMAAGRDILVGERGQTVMVRVSGEARAGSEAGTGAPAAGVVNTGSITTSKADGRAGGRTAVGVGDVYGMALFSSGTVASRDVRLEGQGAGVVDVRGRIDARDHEGKGGEVRVLGEKVALRGASIDASGATGGGTVLVGGNYQGQGAERRADRTYVSADTTIRADALGAGDGGTVVVWSEEVTGFAGTISARGGERGGHGGLVEVSGKRSLAMTGRVDVRAPHGRDGWILLDPRDILIQAGPGGNDVEVGDNQILFGDSALADFVIGAGAVEALLGNITLQAARDITVGSALSLTNQGGGTTFLLQAGRNVTINGAITTAGGAIDLRAGDPASGSPDPASTLSVNAALSSAGGNILLSNTGSGLVALGANVSAGAGLVRINAGSGGASQSGGAITAAGLELLGGGSFSLTSAGNDVDTLAGATGGSVALVDVDGVEVGVAGGTTGFATSGDDLSITAGGGITLSQGINLGSGAVLTLNAGAGVNQTAGSILATNLRLLGTGAFTLTSATNDVGTIAGSVVGAIDYRDAGALTVGTVVSSGLNSGGNNITIQTGGLLTLTQGVVAAGATVFLDSAGGATQSGGAITAAGLRLAGEGGFTLVGSSNDVDTLAALTTGGVTFFDVDDLTVGTVGVSGITTGNGAVLLRASTGSITVSSVIDAGTSQATLLADDMSINAQVRGATLNIAPTSTSRSIGLAGGAGGLALSQGELNNLVATGSVTIGAATSGLLSTGSVALGSATYDLTLQGSGLDIGGITLAGGRTLTLNAGASGATQSGAIVATSLRLLGTGNYVLSNAGNDVSTLAAAVAGGVTFRDANTLGVGTVLTTSGVTATAGGSVLLGSGGAMTLSQDVAALGARVTLDAALGGVTQAGGSIFAGELQLLGAGAGNFSLLSDTNDVGVLSAEINGALAYRDANALEVGNLARAGIVTGGGDASIRTGGLLTLSQQLNAGGGVATINAGAGVSQTGGQVVAGSLELLGTGAFSMNQGNDVGSLAGVIDGTLSFNDANTVAIASVGTSSGLSTTGNMSLSASTNINVVNAVSAGNAFLELIADGMQVGASVSATSGILIRPVTGGASIGLGASTGTIELTDAELALLSSAGGVTIQTTGGAIATSALDLGVPGYDLTLRGGTLATDGVVMGAGRRLTLDFSSGATQTGALVADALRLLGGGSFVLDDVGNDVGTLAGSVAGNIHFFDRNSLIVGAVVSNGLSVTGGGTLRLEAGDGLTLASNLGAAGGTIRLAAGTAGVNQTGGAVAAANLEVTGTGGFVLTGAGNDVSTLAANVAGGFSYRDANALTLGTVGGTSGVSSTGDALVGAGGLLTIAGDLRGDTFTLDTGAGATQTGGTIVVDGLELLGAGTVVLNAGGNDVGTLSANHSGLIAVTDANSVTLGDAGSTLGVTAGNIVVSANNAIAVSSGLSAGGNVTLHAGTGGTGGITFGPGVTVDGINISLRAGDGTGGAGASSFVDALTSSPIFRGVGGVGNPLSLSIRQDASVTSAGLPLAAQFGAGSPAGLGYSLRSDDGNVSITDGSALAGANLTLEGLQGVSITSDLDAGSLAVNSPLTLGGNIRAGTGNVTLGSVTLLGASSIATGLGGTLTMAQGVNAGTHDLTLEGDEIELLGDLVGTGTLTLQSVNTQRSFTLGGGGPTTDLDLTAAELTRIRDGWAQVNIGRADGRHAFNLADAIDFLDNTRLRAGDAGLIAVNGLLTGSTGAALTLDGASLLRASILTNGGVVTLTGPVTIASNVLIDTTNGGSNAAGANIALGSTLDADLGGNNRTLVLSAGTDGVIRSLGAIGAAQQIASLSASGQRIETAGVRTLTTQTYNGASVLNGDLVSTGSGDITFNGTAAIASNSAVRTAGNAGDDVLFNGAVDRATEGSDASLAVDAGAGDVRFAQDAGGGIALSGLTARGGQVLLRSLTSTGDVDLSGVVTTNGVLQGANVTLTGPAFINGDLSGNAVTFNGSTTMVGNLTALGAATFNGDTSLTGNAGVASAAFNGPSSVITGEVTASLGLSIAGNATTSGRLQGESVSIAGDLDVAGDTTVIAGTGALFQGAINSTGNHSLSVTAATTSLQGEVGTDAGRELASLMVGGGDVILGAGAYRTLEAMSLDGNTTITQDTTLSSTNAGVAIGGQVDSGGGDFALTLEGPGTHALAGAGGGGRLGTINVATGTLRLGEGTYNTSGAQNYGANVLVDGDATLNAEGITFGGTIDSGDNGPRALSINSATGPVQLGAVGGTSALSGLVVSASGVTLGNVRTTGSQSYSGPTTLSGVLETLDNGSVSFSGRVSLAGDSSVRIAGLAGDQTVNFGGAVNATGSPFSLDVQANQGRVVFGGDVGLGDTGGDAQLQNLTVQAGSIDVKNVRTVGSQGLAGATTLRGNLTSTGSGSILLDGSLVLTQNTVVTTTQGDITFGGSVNSDGTTRSLDINTGGNGVTRFRGEVGGTSRLASLSTNADGTTRLEGGTIRTTNTQTYNDAVVLAADTAFESTSIVFGSTLDSDNLRTPRALRTSTAGTDASVLFAGNVGSTFALRSVLVDGVGTARVAGNVTTTAGMTYALPVKLRGASTMDGGNGTVFFRGAIDTDTNFAAAPLTLLSSLASGPDNIAFRFGGNIGATERLASLTLGSDLATPARAATIVFSDAFDSGGRIQDSQVAASDRFTISTTGDVTMGLGQKLLALGQIQINAGGTARLGDLASLADIGVTATQIRLRLRPAGQLLDNVFQSPDRLDVDAGLDIVAAGAISFSVRPELEGSGLVTFANNAGRVSDTLSGFTVREFPGGVTRELLRDTRANGTGFLLPLDLKAEGPSTAQLATSLAGAIPRTPDELSGGRTSAMVGESMADPLREMGIATRELSPEESIEFMVGRSIFRDSPGTASPGQGDYRVTVNRLSADAVDRAVMSYRAFVYDFMRDPQGNVVVDEQGNPLTVRRTARIKDALSEAWDGYTAKVPAPTGEGFRAYLETRGNQATPAEREALEYLTRCREVLQAFDGLGLSDFETSIPRTKLLNSIRPGGMTPDELRAAVEGAARVSMK